MDSWGSASDWLAGSLGMLDYSRVRRQIVAGLLPLLSNLGDFPPSLLPPFCADATGSNRRFLFFVRVTLIIYRCLISCAQSVFSISFACLVTRCDSEV